MWLTVGTLATGIHGPVASAFRLQLHPEQRGILRDSAILSGQWSYRIWDISFYITGHFVS